jgi:hypothetical protein
LDRSLPQAPSLLPSRGPAPEDLAGGIAGALIGMGIPEYEANRYEGRLKEGGILLSVHADDSDWKNKAKDILKRTGAQDVGDKGESGADYDVSDRPEPKVRRTNFEVERQGTGPYDEDFRRNFDAQYSRQGERYDTYSPAYQYGSTLSTMTAYKGKDWSEIKQNAHNDWESRHPGTWEKFKDSIRYGWDKTKSKI